MTILYALWWAVIAVIGNGLQLIGSFFRRQGPPCPVCGAPW